MCWNVWSVLGDEKLLNVLNMVDDQDIDIICLCETWFDAQTGRFTALIREAGYEITHANRDGTRGGGVAVLYKKTMKVKPGDFSATKYTSFEYASCIFHTSAQKIMIICVYRKQEISCISFCEEFEKFMDSVFHKGDQVIIVGDFNVWIEQSSTESAMLRTMMNAHGLDQVVKEPTHIAGHTLDHVYVNECQVNIECEVGDRCDVKTEHFPITFSLLQMLNNLESGTVRYRDKKKYGCDERIRGGLSRNRL